MSLGNQQSMCHPGYGVGVSQRLDKNGQPSPSETQARTSEGIVGCCGSIKQGCPFLSGFIPRGNNLFSSIRWYGVAARCVRLTTLGEASSKFAFQSCYLKVFWDFFVHIHQFWLICQNNADITVFHRSDLAVHFGKTLQVINWI